MSADTSELDFGATIRAFSPGQKVFARFTLTRLLGRGGMGVVWLAHDEKLERDVALKFLPEAVALDPRSVDDLKRETRRSLDLTHPNIVRIYDFFEDNSAAAISLEYVEGGTLSRLAVDQPKRCYEPHQLEGWMRQLSQALEYAHEKAQIVHRDLKPANLMVTAQGDLKVTDFGIAATVTDSVTRVSRMASSGATPAYASPQQVMGERPSTLDDVYSMGATIFDLVTSRPPFHSGNLFIQVQSKPAPTMTERRRELGITGVPIPAAWERTVAACLAKDPAGRPQSARAVLEGLEGRPIVVNTASGDSPAAGGTKIVTPDPVVEKPRDVEVKPEPREPTSPTPPVWPAIQAQLGAVLSGRAGRGAQVAAFAVPVFFVSFLLWLLLPGRGPGRSGAEAVTTSYGPSIPQPSSPESTVPVYTPGPSAVAPVDRSAVSDAPSSSSGSAGASSQPASSSGWTASGESQAAAPTVNYVPPEPPPAPKYGTIRIVSEPSGATVQADGRTLGTTPLTLQADVGPAGFLLTRPGYEDLPVSAEIQSDRTVTITAPMRAVQGREEKSGRNFVVADLQATMIWVEGGEFTIGSPVAESGPDSDERPQTRVRMRGFWIGRTEVTRAQWAALTGTGSASGGDNPVTRVSWEEAAAFCQRLTERERTAGRLPTGYIYRLPSEAQWEYACRAGTTGPYAGDLRQLGHTGQRGGSVRAVARGQPNAWGLYDMHGNVAEWTSSWYGTYPGGTVIDYEGPDSGVARVFRGGAFDSIPKSARSAYRGYVRGSTGAVNRGFRIALAPEPMSGMSGYSAETDGRNYVVSVAR